MSRVKPAPPQWELAPRVLSRPIDFEANNKYAAHFRVGDKVTYFFAGIELDGIIVSIEDKYNGKAKMAVMRREVPSHKEEEFYGLFRRTFADGTVR